eukprot:scaffold137105_cov115-Phaeocystis_antarctica.AAC.1
MEESVVQLLRLWKEPSSSHHRGRHRPAMRKDARSRGGRLISRLSGLWVSLQSERRPATERPTDRHYHLVFQLRKLGQLSQVPQVYQLHPKAMAGARAAAAAAASAAAATRAAAAAATMAGRGPNYL